MQIVHVDTTVEHLLTVEKMVDGKPVGELCDINGVTLPRDSQHLTRKVYLDTISGVYVLGISHEEKEAMLKAGNADKVYQGAGRFSGWFTDAPDFTLKGRHGEYPGDEVEAAPVTSRGAKPKAA